MIDFQTLLGPFGIPVYYQRLPVRSAAICWIVFVGSADDDTVGHHGIYHWFEHIPSRGTRKYPAGYRDTEARLIRYGGAADAETGYTYTSYEAHVPRRAWREALDILTDMIAQPLLRAADIQAEREIIRQEIDEWHSSPYGAATCQLPSILWPSHPLGHDQLGTHETLAKISPAMLQEAHTKGYARSRCALFVAGDLDEAEVIDEVARAAETLPESALDERRKPASYGALPSWSGGDCTTIATGHDDSVAYLLFPIPPLDSPRGFLPYVMTEELITAGDLGSPLHRIVREHSQLAYSPEFSCLLNPDGGYWGLVAQTARRKSDEVIQALWDVLKSEELRRKKWHDYVRDTIQGEIDMHDPCPATFIEVASERLVHHGVAWSDKEFLDRLLKITREEMNDFLDSITEDMARAIVFAGRRDLEQPS